MKHIKGEGRARYLSLLKTRAASGCPRHQTLLDWVTNPPQLLVLPKPAAK